MNILAAFKARGEALRLYEELKSKRIAATVINTPKRAGLSCGLSVVFSSAYRLAAEEIIRRMGLRSFIGFFSR